MTDTVTPTAERAHRAAKRYIYAWGGGKAEGDATMRDLLGGKGAGLAEMTNAGLPVPPGFTITTEACNDYFAAGERLPDGLWDDVLEAVKEVERETGKGFGNAANPLLVSVRSGAKFSMPGMMDTVLNLGLNEDTLRGPHRAHGQRALRLGRLPALHPDVRADRHGREGRALRPRARRREGRRTGPQQDTDLDAADDLRALADDFKAHRPRGHRPRVPERSVRAARARHQGRLRLLVRQARRRLPRQPQDRPRPGHRRQRRDDGLRQHGRRLRARASPSRATRTPARRSLFGEYLTNAQGEDVVAGIRTAPKIAQMRDRHARGLRGVRAHRASSSSATTATSRTSSSPSSAASCTCSRRAPPSGPPRPPCKIAADLVDEGMIDQGRGAAAHRAGPRRPAAARPVRPRRPAPRRRGSPRASTRRPGAAVGQAVFDADTAVEWVGRGERVMLVRIETSPDDFHGMAVAQGVLTARGGATSHAAVVARQIGKPCVAGCRELVVDYGARTAAAERRHVQARATGSASMARPARSSSARCRPSRPGSRTSPSSSGSSAGRTRSAGCRSGPTPTSPRRRRWPGATGRRASACAVPSTCSARASGSRSCATRSSSRWWRRGRRRGPRQGRR